MLPCRLLLRLLSLSHVQLFSDSMDCSPPGSSIHEIPQARIPEWVAIPFSRASSWSRDRILIFCIDRWILYHWATREGSVFYSVSEICTVLRKPGQVPTPQRTRLLLLSGWDSLPQRQSRDTCRGPKMRLSLTPALSHSTWVTLWTNGLNSLTSVSPSVKQGQ